MKKIILTTLCLISSFIFLNKVNYNTYENEVVSNINNVETTRVHYLTKEGEGESSTKIDLEYEFTFESGATFSYDGTGEAPNIKVNVLTEGAIDGVDYTWYFSYDDDTGTHEIGQTIPTTPGTYGLTIKVSADNDKYNELRDFRWFRITHKQVPTIQFSFDNGASFAYDGTGDAPDFSVTVPDGVTYKTYFEEDGTNIGTDIPTTPGTYSFICETEENDTYNAKRDYRWFKITSPSLVDPEITFGGETNFVWDGLAHTPTFTVSSGATYSIRYDSNNTFYSYDAPTEVGTYALVVTVSEGNGFNASTKWVVFRIKYTKESFVTEWKALRNNTDQSICSYISSDTDTYDNLIAKMTTYSFKEEDIAWIKEQTDIEGVTIGETMAYIENARLLSNNSLNSGINLINYESQSSLLCIVIVMVFGLAFVSGYYLYKKKSSIN